jgi:hypothetical protein
MCKLLFPRLITLGDVGSSTLTAPEITRLEPCKSAKKGNWIYEPWNRTACVDHCQLSDVERRPGILSCEIVPQNDESNELFLPSQSALTESKLHVKEEDYSDWPGLPLCVSSDDAILEPFRPCGRARQCDEGPTALIELNVTCNKPSHRIAVPGFLIPPCRMVHSSEFKRQLRLRCKARRAQSKPFANWRFRS